MSPVSGFQIVTRRKKCPNVAISFPSRLHAAAVTSLLCTSSLRWWIAKSRFVSEREVAPTVTIAVPSNSPNHPIRNRLNPKFERSLVTDLVAMPPPKWSADSSKTGIICGKWLLTENSPCQPGTPNFRAKPLAGGVAAQRRAGGGSLTRPSDGRIAAVDQQIAAGNKARHIARQIDRRTRDLLGPSQAAEQMLAADLLVRRGKRAVTVQRPLRLDRARRQRVDPDVLRGMV